MKGTDTAKQFFSARKLTQFTKMQQGDPIEKVLDAFEVANREAQRQGTGGGIHGPAAEILSGIHQLRGSTNQNKSKEPLHEKSNKEVSKNRQIGSLKAELVRNQIVTRGDLMKLYQPPIKKSQLPTANPFLSKNLLDPIPTEEPSSKGAEKVGAGNYTSFGDLYASQVNESKESRRSQSFMKKTYAHGQKKAPARMHSSNSMARA